MPVPLVEDAAIPDIFISGIARIERLSGGLVRITYFKEQRNNGGEMEHVIVLRVIRALDTWPRAVEMVTRALTEDGPVTNEDFVDRKAH